LTGIFTGRSGEEEAASGILTESSDPSRALLLVVRGRDPLVNIGRLSCSAWMILLVILHKTCLSCLFSFIFNLFLSRRPSHEMSIKLPTVSSPPQLLSLDLANAESGVPLRLFPKYHPTHIIRIRRQEGRLLLSSLCLRLCGLIAAQVCLINLHHRHPILADLVLTYVQLRRESNHLQFTYHLVDKVP
jgi:hypothetical protein